MGPPAVRERESCAFHGVAEEERGGGGGWVVGSGMCAEQNERKPKGVEQSFHFVRTIEREGKKSTMLSVVGRKIDHIFNFSTVVYVEKEEE
jgi:hypothetical protein